MTRKLIWAATGLTLAGITGIAMVMAEPRQAPAFIAGDQPVTEGQKKGLPPVQILTQKDITFDPTKGWQAYPDFAQRFAKLWGAGS